MSQPTSEAIPSVSVIRLCSQVKKILKELAIAENSLSNLEVVINTLINTHAEYQKITLSSFSDSVKSIFNNILPDSSSKKEALSALASPSKEKMNLNQSMSLAQKALASKRQRPDEPTSSLPHTDSQISLSKQSEDRKGEPKEKKRKPNPDSEGPPSSSIKAPKASNSFLVERPRARFNDLAGLDTVLDQFRELVCYPLMYPNLYAHLGVCPPCGILLYGPSGCGKTTLANAIAGETGLNYFKVRHFRISPSLSTKLD